MFKVEHSDLRYWAGRKTLGGTADGGDVEHTEFSARFVFSFVFYKILKLDKSHTKELLQGKCKASK